MFTDIALIDADSIYFRVACVTQKQNEIRKAIDYTMTEIKRNTMTNNQLCAVKGRGNFRNDLYSDYKGNRKELDPKVKEALNYGHGYMVEKYNAIMADNMEADDLVAIWAYEQMDMDQTPIIVGIDKDLLQIPGWHYNFVKKQTPIYVNGDEAHLKLMLQCLTGDTADNIPGIKGIGPKKAEKILKGVPIERRWDRVRAAWRGHKAGNPELSHRLLKMLTSWKEYEDIRNRIAGEASVSERDVSTEQTQDSGVQELSNGNQG